MPDMYNVHLKCESASEVYEAHYSEIGGHKESHYVEAFERLVSSKEWKTNERYARQNGIEREWEPIPNDLPVRLEVTKNTYDRRGLCLLLHIHLAILYFGRVTVLATMIFLL